MEEDSEAIRQRKIFAYILKERTNKALAEGKSIPQNDILTNFLSSLVQGEENSKVPEPQESAIFIASEAMTAQELNTPSPPEKLPKKPVQRPIKPSITRHVPNKPSVNRPKQTAKAAIIAKQEMDEKAAAEIAECTFHPKINRKKAPQTSMPTSERLYSTADRKYRKRAQQKELQENLEASQCTFQPQIHSKSSNHIPIHERTTEILKDRSEDLSRLKYEQQLADQHSFKPELNPASRQLASHSKSESAFARLSGNDKASVEKRTKLAEKRAQEDHETCTFAPKTNGYTSDTLQGLGFMERQQYYEAKRERDTTDISEEYCTFKPKINPISRVITNMNNSAASMRNDPVSRLAEDDVMRRDTEQRVLVKEHMSAYPFTPQLNEITKQIAQPSTLDDLVKYKQREIGRNVLIDIQNAAYDEIYKFKPQINSNINVESKYKQGKDILKEVESEIEKRENLLKVQRQAVLEEEARDCKFAPSVEKYSPSKANAPVYIQGLEQFLAQRDRAQAIKASQAAREDEVFGYNYLPREKTTVPEPFQLTEATKFSNKEKITHELRKAEAENCTFRPKLFRQEI